MMRRAPAFLDLGWPVRSRLYTVSRPTPRIVAASSGVNASRERRSASPAAALASGSARAAVTCGSALTVPPPSSPAAHLATHAGTRTCASMVIHLGATVVLLRFGRVTSFADRCLI